MPSSSSSSAEVKVKKLAKLPSNQVCPNCSTRQKHGFSTVCMKFHTFVCNNCKSSHQAISHRCKSLTMSSWSNVEVEELEHKGNDYARRTYLKHAPACGTEGRPCPTSHLAVFKSFVINAYEHKQYYGQDDGAAVQPAPPRARQQAAEVKPAAVVADLLDFTTTPTTTTASNTTSSDDFASFSADFGDFQTAAPAASTAMATPTATLNASHTSGGLLAPPPSSSLVPKISSPPPSSTMAFHPTFTNNNNSMNTAANQTTGVMHTSHTLQQPPTNGGSVMTMNGSSSTTRTANCISAMTGPTMMNTSNGMMNGMPMNAHNGMPVNNGVMNSTMPMNNGFQNNTGMPMNASGMNMNGMNAFAPNNTGMNAFQQQNGMNGGMMFPQAQMMMQQPQQPMMYHAQGMQATMSMNNCNLGNINNGGTQSANNNSKKDDPFAGLGGF